jgi:hypothetical protein
MPVNTVLRRQFDVTKHRYERALESAKRAAYLARLSIEQRLGTRMNDLAENIGAIEAPALWVDDLCSVQGINYNALRTALPPGQGGSVVGEGGSEGSGEPGAEELDLIAGFSDQYIGDYVARLKEFVEFYNLRYPFREGDDTAIVSLREDARNSEARCLRDSKNLLSHSDRLDTAPEGIGSDDRAIGGWRVSGCAGSVCLVLSTDAPLVDNSGMTSTPLAPPEGLGAATLFKTVSGESLSVQLGAAEESLGPLVEPGPRMPAAVYQTVTLRGGDRYALSWWDIARHANGGNYTAGTPPKSYRASVSTAGWELVSSNTFEPEHDGAEWSERRILAFNAPVDGEYHIAFAPVDTAGIGVDFAIANVQLEATASQAFGPTPYEATDAGRIIFSGVCPIDDPATFRSRFDYRCGSDGCFYEMRNLFLIDTEILSQGFSSLIGKVGVGNYNYRHTNTAVNLVGTGVLDCTNDPRSSCYSSAYLEYDFTHFAFNVPLIDYSNDVRCFNFGAGQIRSGKVLAAERVLSLPMGSADRELISQPAFLKPEFSGRPLSGSYRFRIKDTPALAWEKVEDVQIVLNYRYWSRVARGPNN